MKSKFKFDQATGTYVPSDPGITQGIKANVKDDIKQTASTPDVSKPKFKQERKIEIESLRPNIQEHQVLQLKRVERPTPIQLLGNDGKPESYLDSVNTGIMMFRESQDYDMCQITDERSGKALAFIGGYALQMSFNMEELNTMEKIEGCLEGLTKLFRHKIMNQALGKPH